jgi:ADP-heptose:LPS heptosyltransferase
MIANCDLFIGNDSGLSHLAAAVGTPLIVLWGAANLEMARPKALPERCLILYEEMPCREFCPEILCINRVEVECLKKIQPKDVIEAARRFLNQVSHGSRSAAQPILCRK